MKGGINDLICPNCGKPAQVTRYGKWANHKDPRTRTMCARSGKRVEPTKKM